MSAYDDALEAALETVRELQPGEEVFIKRSGEGENSEFVVSGPIESNGPPPPRIKPRTEQR